LRAGLVAASNIRHTGACSGNGRNGIEIIGPAAGNVVVGNNIGTNKSGEAAIPNELSGISIDQAPGNTIGGTVPLADNVISGNKLDGITIHGEKAVGNVVGENLIGIDTNSVAALPNGRHGIFIDGAVSTAIGGTAELPLIVSGNKVPTRAAHMWRMKAIRSRWTALVRSPSSASSPSTSGIWTTTASSMTLRV
jgi:hypothetical protein